MRVSPPPELAALYQKLAARHRALEPVLRAAAEGGFGSGFVLVRRGQGPANTAPRPFVVTNRHVVSLASRATLGFEGESERLDAVVVHVDPVYDLAVLAPVDPPESARWPSRGLDFSSGTPKDQQPIVASGYPGLGRDPSYQVTRGYVSNERFLLDDGAGKFLYVQHTAPIDPGSSGGPLTTEDGKLVGVNTLKARRREGVGLAVPAPAVQAAVERAAALDPTAGPDATGARDACIDLLRSLAEGPQGLAATERAIGTSLTATEGWASLGYLPSDKDEWVDAFVDDPTRVLLRAVALRLGASGPKDGSAASEEPCTPAAPSPDPARFAFNVSTRLGSRIWTFGREQGRYKLLTAALAPAKGGGIPGGRAPRSKKWTPSLR